MSDAKQSGFKLQERARKLLKVPDREFGASNLDEELWNSEVQFEVKSGKQVNSTMSLFEKAETQSWEYELTKDNPKELFSLLAMPEGTKDGLFICRLSLIKEVVLELQQMWKEENDNGLDKK